MRPDVVLFNELLPVAALENMDLQLEKGFELVVSIGTSSQFAYIIQPVLLAVRAGIPTIEINPARTELSAIVDVHLKLGARAALSAIQSGLTR
jgi:NAD-dependent deacetylase